MDAELKALFDRSFISRAPWAKKGDAGTVLVIAGSEVYSGSPIFNAVSALRSGSDLVNVVGHPRAMQIVAGYAPDMITIPLRGELSMGDVPAILERAQRFSALVIGGGLSRTEETFEAIRAIVAGATLPMVLDAEAIRAIAGHESMLAGKKILLTPNAGEFEVLAGGPLSTVVTERSDQVLRLANKLGVSVLLKGHIDHVSEGVKVVTNETGNPAMAKGGFGDTLAGIAGSFLARGMSSFDAGLLAAYVNGRAGELACREYGEGVLASDIFTLIPKVIREERGEQ